MTPATNLILSILKTAADRQRLVTMTHTEIAKQANVDASTVTRAVRDLIAEGYIIRRSNPGDGKPSVYEINEKPVPVAADVADEFPDGCNPNSGLEKHVHQVLTDAGIPHLHDVPYRLIHPDWQNHKGEPGEHRCDFLIGHGHVIECGRDQVGPYQEVREHKRREAHRLGITLIDIPSKLFATNYFGQGGSFRLMGLSIVPRDGLDQFLSRIAELPHPSLPEFISRCRSMLDQAKAADRIDCSPRPPPPFETWQEYNDAVDAQRAREEAGRAEERAAREREWDRLNSPEEVARRAEQERLADERRKAREHWGDLLEDDDLDDSSPARLHPRVTAPDETDENSHEGGSWNGVGEPSTKQMEMMARLDEEERREYRDDDHDWD